MAVTDEDLLCFRFIGECIGIIVFHGPRFGVWSREVEGGGRVAVVAELPKIVNFGKGP